MCSCKLDDTHCLTAEGSWCGLCASTPFCDYITLSRCWKSPFNDDDHRFAMMITFIRKMTTFLRWWSKIKGRECRAYLLSEFNIGFRFEVMWSSAEPQTYFNLDTHAGEHVEEFWSKCWWYWYCNIAIYYHWYVYESLLLADRLVAVLSLPENCNGRQTDQLRIFSWILTSGASFDIHISFKRSRQCYLWSKKESLKVTFLEKSLISDFDFWAHLEIVWESFSNLILPFDISEWNAKFALISFPHFKFSFASSNLACTTSMKLQTQSPKS